MKIKKNIFSIGMVGVLFASCSNDYNLESPTLPNGSAQEVIEGEPTYATFTFKADSKNGGTRVAPEVAPGTGAVTDVDGIGRVFLLIFNEQSKVLENKFVINKGISTATYLITSGKKRIFAFTNLVDKSGLNKVVNLEEKKATIDEMLKLKVDTGTDLGQNSDSIAMSTPDIGEVHTVENGITENDAPTKNQVEISMSRMLARVQLNLKTDVETTFKAKGFVMNNVAKSTYIVQNATGGVVKSPLYEKTWGGGITAADFMALESFYSTGTTPKVDSDLRQLDSRYYLTENTSPSFLKGAATHLILKGIFIPNRIIASASFSVATQNLNFTYINTPTETDCANYCYVTESSKASIIPVQTFFKDKAALTNAINAYNTGIKDATKEIKTDDVKYIEYDKGSYYRINIGEGIDASTVFGVKRNTTYKVVVNSVTGPGFKKPDGPDGAEGVPTDPIDQKTYINVTIKATDWATADQSVDIN